MRAPIGRTLLGGLAAGLAVNLAILLTFRLVGFGLDAHGILLNPSLQSQKLIALWTVIEPLPLIVTHPVAMALGFVALAVLHAFVYRWLAPGWPPGILRRALRMTALLFFLSYLFFEFFTPFNQLHEPLPLVALELAFWALAAFAEAFTLAWLIE
jgi:hypothetical protein